jgi:hypothetical protein
MIWIEELAAAVAVSLFMATMAIWCAVLTGAI